VYVADCVYITEVVPASTSCVIPLSVEMLSDSDDEDDRKPQLTISSSQPRGTVKGQPSGSVDGNSKLLLLKMASEFVEAAAAAATSTQPTTEHSMTFVFVTES